MIKVGIVGGTGYTGAELVRLLLSHPNVELSVITSRSEAGKRVDELFPSLRTYCDLRFTVPETDTLLTCDVIFFATPHGVAQSQVKPLIDGGVRVIDLSADFRIQDIALWEKWYNQKHACPELVASAVYGLPEVNREAIADAQLIACPGCYPTSVQLGLKPLMTTGQFDPASIIVNAASGISGAGRNAKTGLLLAENYDSFKAYGVAGHRHLPEIEQGLNAISTHQASVNITFVPHLLPIIRGIHSTIYVHSDLSLEEAYTEYNKQYKDAVFVDVLPQGVYPETKTVKGTNLCRISLEKPQGGNVLVIMSVIDNLAKGASAQAIQNMNLMFNLPESEALTSPALLP